MLSKELDRRIDGTIRLIADRLSDGSEVYRIMLTNGESQVDVECEDKKAANRLFVALTDDPHSYVIR